MAEYIEKQMAIKAVCDACYAVPDREKENCQYKYEEAGCIEYDKIINVPPADVRPVVRGKWKSENTDALTLDVRTCSVCGLKKVFITNFCPSCGADMRGGDADGDEKD